MHLPTICLKSLPVFFNLIEPYEQAVVCKTFVWEGFHIMISILPYPTQSRNCWSKIICTMQLWCHVNYVGFDVATMQNLVTDQSSDTTFEQAIQNLWKHILQNTYQNSFPYFSLMGVIKGSKWWFKVVLKSLGNIYNMF